MWRHFSLAHRCTMCVISLHHTNCDSPKMVKRVFRKFSAQSAWLHVIPVLTCTLCPAFTTPTHFTSIEFRYHHGTTIVATLPANTFLAPHRRYNKSPENIYVVWRRYSRIGSKAAEGMWIMRWRYDWWSQPSFAQGNWIDWVECRVGGMIAATRRLGEFTWGWNTSMRIAVRSYYFFNAFLFFSSDFYHLSWIRPCFAWMRTQHPPKLRGKSTQFSIIKIDTCAIPGRRLYKYGKGYVYLKVQAFFAG